MFSMIVFTTKQSGFHQKKCRIRRWWEKWV